MKVKLQQRMSTFQIPNIEHSIHQCDNWEPHKVCTFTTRTDISTQLSTNMAEMMNM